jgi:hypothetical protein
MPKVVNEELMELLKPAIHKRIEELLEDAFKLATCTDCGLVLEGAIDRLTVKYFQKGEVITGSSITSSGSYPEEGMLGTSLIKNPSSILLERDIPSMGCTLGKNLVKSPRFEKPANLADHERTRTGRPISKYPGVSYNGRKNRPWLARYNGKRLGSFAREEEASQAYETYKRNATARKIRA